jgi:hypothetical protein
VNQSGSEEDLPIIDARLPAERLADSGRDGIARLRERLRNSALDVAAAFGELIEGGLGIVVVLVAMSLLSSRRAVRSTGQEIGDLD